MAYDDASVFANPLDLVDTDPTERETSQTKVMAVLEQQSASTGARISTLLHRCTAGSPRQYSLG